MKKVGNICLLGFLRYRIKQRLTLKSTVIRSELIKGKGVGFLHQTNARLYTILVTRRKLLQHECAFGLQFVAVSFFFFFLLAKDQKFYQPGPESELQIYIL